MTLQIDRFSMKGVNNDSKKFPFAKKTSVFIWDHKDDKSICHINLYDNLEKNKDLAGKIIETIENHILEAEDGSSK